MRLTDLIFRAPWRESVTYRDARPHEYVLSEKDRQQEMLKASCERFRAGGGEPCRFSCMKITYLLIVRHKFWLMTHWKDIEPGGDYVINRALLYRDRRDFVAQHGDSGEAEDYPRNPAYENRVFQDSRMYGCAVLKELSAMGRSGLET